MSDKSLKEKYKEWSMRQTCWDYNWDNNGLRHFGPFEAGYNLACSELTRSVVVDHESVLHVSAVPRQISYEKEIEELKQKLAECEEALRFYGDKENWSRDEDYDGYDISGIIKSCDNEIIDKSKDLNYHGGKRARQYFSKWSRE